MENKNITGMVSDSQRFSLHDGPGIRTTIYLKGCNMTCIWCHNPESIDPKPDIAFYKSKCIGCGQCYQSCPTAAIMLKEGMHYYDKMKCTECYQCINDCPSGALSLIGREMTVEQVLDIILADKPYYKSSDGGMTVSGGEPLMQTDFVLELLKKCREHGIDTAIETNMSFPFKAIEQLLPYLNRIYCDIKSMDDVMHKKTTSVSNGKVLDNISKLAVFNIPIVIRTPLIPGLTDSDENIRRSAKWIKENSNAEYYELLNYNSFAKMKYENIFKEYGLKDCKPLSKGRVQELAGIAAKEGISVVVG